MLCCILTTKSGFLSYYMFDPLYLFALHPTPLNVNDFEKLSEDIVNIRKILNQKLNLNSWL